MWQLFGLLDRTKPMRVYPLPLMCAGSLLLCAVETPAHHSLSAAYDSSRPITIQGTVAKVEWTNPHSWIYVDVKKPNGTVESWKTETGPPSGLQRSGWTQNALPTGTAITIEGYRATGDATVAVGRF